MSPPEVVDEGFTILWMPLLAVSASDEMQGTAAWSWVVRVQEAVDSVLVSATSAPAEKMSLLLMGWLREQGFGSPTEVEIPDVGEILVYPFHPGDRPRIVALF